MSLFALDPFWNDLYAAGGFWVGVVGLVVGVAGFWIAIVQIRDARNEAKKGKEAAEAARDAANKTLAESKDAYERFVGAFASRLLSELEGAVGAKDWRLGRFRCNDVAELLASLPAAREPNVTAVTAKCVLELREIGRLFAELEAKQAIRMSKAAIDKWVDAQQLTHATLDRLRKPFREVQVFHGEAPDRDPRPAPPADGPEPPLQNPGEAGALGSGPQPQ